MADAVALEDATGGAGPDADPVPPTRSGGSHYRPHLDGLRAVAVYLVVVFHARVTSLSGGFIGVDVFFVLSGFLVTRLLLRDLDGGGAVQFGRFYARRFRRLLPAAAVTLLITAVVYSAVAGPGDAAGAVGAFRACFLYVANWYFIHQSAGYFGAAVQQNPVLHFWSLAVEEQFYVLWPLVLGGLFWIARRVSRPTVPMVRMMVAAAAGLSLVWALVLQHSNADHAYYGTDARAYQLLGGALLALTPGLVTRAAALGSRVRWAGVAALGCLFVLASSLLHLGPIWRGAATVVVVLVLLTSLEAAPSGPLHRVLSSGPFVYLGRISYGIYLWHWPVIVVATLVADPSPGGLTALSVLVGTGLAAMSYELLEMPIRRSELLDRYRLPVIVSGLVISLLCGIVIAPAILRRSPSDASLAIAAQASFTPLPEGLNLDRVAAAGFGSSGQSNCVGKDPSACIVVKGTGATYFLMGDSNAEMLIPAFEAFARANNLTLALGTTRGCPWQRGLNWSNSLKAECDRDRVDTYSRVIPALKPDVVVAVNTAYPVTLIRPRKLEAATPESINQLKAPGRKVVLVEPIVQAPSDQDPLACLQKAKFVEDCRYTASAAPGPVTQYYRQLASKDRTILSADFDRLACPYLPICDPIIGGDVVHWDHQHLATAYASTLGPDLTKYFTTNGLLGG